MIEHLEGVNHLLHSVERLLLPVSTLIEIFGILVIVVGVVRAAIGIVRRLPSDTATDIREAQFSAIRVDLGYSILLGLEILICADIIYTIISRTTDDIILLGAIVIIRTIIAFFLAREVQEARESVTLAKRKFNQDEP